MFLGSFLCYIKRNGTLTEGALIAIEPYDYPAAAHTGPKTTLSINNNDMMTLVTMINMKCQMT